MKRVLLSVSLSLGLLFSGTAHSLANSWQQLSSAQEPAHLDKAVFPVRYDVYHMTAEEMRNTLLKAGYSAAEGVIITLPIGNGEYQTLKVYRDDVMPKKLQEKYPDIVTFTGFDPGDHSITAKIGFDMYGFNAMITKPGLGSYILDPYSKASTEFYIGYLHRDLDASIYKRGACGVGNDKKELLPFIESTGAQLNLNSDMNSIDNPSQHVDILRANGSVKRVYKLAISCTGEWAQSMAGTGVPPTMAGTLASLVTLVNRANGVFQRELSVKMEMIENNEAIIYINPFSDPYTCNFDNDCLINEVQTNLNGVLVGTPYDIGHIVNTAGGGLAELNSVCNPESKARGVSGAFTTSDITTIIHEMGHQMGTHHTFIAGSGSCNGQGNEPTSYEPGSGSSIMSYNGGCDPNNVAAPEYDYYHVGSLKMITDFIVLGAGASCGTTTPAFGTTTIMPLGMKYFIPTNTPFELISSETSHPEPATPTSITYNWEQYDTGELGATEANGSTAEEGPIFLSRAPSLKRDRQFPDNSIVISNTYTAVGQRLPNVERSLSFKLTTRSYFEGWGTFNFSDDQVDIDVVGMDAFRVNKPDVNTLYDVGAPITVSWDTTLTRQEPISCGFVNIYMSRDGGETFNTLVVANAPNTGSYTLAAPDVYSDQIYFKVKASGNIFYDISKTPVRIHGDPTSNDEIADIVQNLLIYPNPAHDLINIENPFTVTEPLQVILYDISGRTITTHSFSHDAQINVERLSAGNYFLSIKNPSTGFIHTEKIVIN